MVISTFPHFFGAQKLGMREKGGQLGGGVCTQTPSLGRMALDGFGTSSLKMWCCTYMHIHGTWIYMDLHGCTWKLSTPHVRVPGDVDARLENTTCNLREQRRLFSIRNQMLRYCGEILRSDPVLYFFFRMFHAKVSSKTRSDGSLSLHAKAREGRGCCGSLSFFYLRQRKNSMETANERG